MAMLEQGEGMDRAQFDALLAELKARRPALEAVPADDPRAEKARALQARADELERRAAARHGQMEQVNNILSPLMGRQGE